MISTRLFRTVLLVAMHEYDHNYEFDEAIGNTLAKLIREVRERVWCNANVAVCYVWFL